MCLEFLYGHSLKRWKYVTSNSGYDLKCESCRIIVENKLALVLNCRKCWPMHASIAEDIKFRKEIWNLHFPPNLLQLIVLHDNTNVTLKELTDAVQHKLTRSEHYKECCVKGGDTCQPCGWNMGLHLCTRNTPDILCVKLVKVLEQQNSFQDYCLNAGLIRKVINIFDKGYRLSLEAAKLDQICLQPYFAKSYTQFSRHELLSSGAVSCSRPVNKRNIKVMKRSRIIQQVVPTADLDLKRLHNMWIAWGFQVNFMHKPCV